MTFSVARNLVQSWLLRLIVMYVDFGFTTGKYNGSSISVFSRNPVMETDREIAVVSGRGKFRMARGLIVMYVDFGFTTGKYNGSSISVFSRNPVMETDREIAVVGGRGKFRMARGYAKLKASYFNATNGDAIIEYKMTVFHY
ncbi:hypothetical protein HHK36_009324 [Tetracentron sinense]|uniref:Dirigent protein n=1 Tax=Tetracentron sinense TaxID=13715 RepID=A0A834ZAP2_TETSI|nr:hypothetical protein HHK36_009324 [Tetracentron sinense]